MTVGCHGSHVGRGRISTSASQKRLLFAVALTAALCAVEAVGGYLSSSLALLSDAGHMLADLFALVLSMAALKFAALPATPEKSYGYYRLEILSALANGLLLVLVAATILFHAWERFHEPQIVQSTPMLVVASIGLVANIVVAWILAPSTGNLNVRGAYLHVLGDTLSSVGVIIGGMLIALTGEPRIDPVIGALIALVILATALRLIRDATDVLLEAIPKGLEIADVTNAILEIDGVIRIHDLHVWSLTTGVEALSAHILVAAADLPNTDRIIDDVNRQLQRLFQIGHTTLQVESDDTSHLESSCG